MTTAKTRFTDVFARISRGENIPDAIIQSLPEQPVGCECYGAEQYTPVQTLISVMPLAVELALPIDPYANWEKITQIIVYNGANTFFLERESIKRSLWELGATADFAVGLMAVETK